MARLTPLSLADARGLARGYDLEFVSVEPLDAGSVNSNFRLRSADGATWFGRLYEEQGEAGARFEATLARALSLRGVPVAVPLQARDGGVPSHAGRPFSLAPWIEGESLCQARVTPAHARAVGEALARVHATAEVAPPRGRFELSDLERRLERVEREGSSELVRAAGEARGVLARAAAGRSAGLPEGLVHGDLFRDNVLWREGELVALLDFESASAGVLAYDLAVTLLAWCFGDELDRALVGAMVGGYESVRPLSACEREGLAAEARMACARFTVTRLTDYSLRAPPGQPPRRDFRRFLARLAAIDAGALDLR
ncbi:MAG: homoserine kinase [Polyangiaceae bacterium]|nr:homoserine kinase [Polyangiaceae bacterium]